MSKREKFSTNPQRLGRFAVRRPPKLARPMLRGLLDSDPTDGDPPLYPSPQDTISRGGGGGESGEEEFKHEPNGETFAGEKRRTRTSHGERPPRETPASPAGEPPRHSRTSHGQRTRRGSQQQQGNQRQQHQPLTSPQRNHRQKKAPSVTLPNIDRKPSVRFAAGRDARDGGSSHLQHHHRDNNPVRETEGGGDDHGDHLYPTASDYGDDRSEGNSVTVQSHSQSHSQSQSQSQSHGGMDATGAPRTPTALQASRLVAAVAPPTPPNNTSRGVSRSRRAKRLPETRIPERFHVHEQEPVVDPASHAAGVSAIEDRLFHPSFDDESGTGASSYVRRVFPSSNPVSRREVAHLQLTLQEMLREISDPRELGNRDADAPGAAAGACLDAIAAEQSTLDVAFSECARQVSAHCYERGETLRLVWSRSQHLHRLLPHVIADLQSQLADERAYSDALRGRLGDYLDAAQDESANREARLAAHVRHLEAHLDAQEDQVVKMRDALQREQDSDPARVIARQRRVIAALQESVASAAGGESALEERIEELKSEIQNHEIVQQGMVKRLAETRAALLETRKLLIRTDFDGERFYDTPLTEAAAVAPSSGAMATTAGNSSTFTSPTAAAASGSAGAPAAAPAAPAAPAAAAAAAAAAARPSRTSSYTGGAVRVARGASYSDNDGAPSLVTGLPMTSPSAPPRRLGSSASLVAAATNNASATNLLSGSADTGAAKNAAPSSPSSYYAPSLPGATSPTKKDAAQLSSARSAGAASQRLIVEKAAVRGPDPEPVSREDAEAEEAYLAARAKCERERYNLATEIVSRLTEAEVARLEERRFVRAQGGPAQPMASRQESDRTKALLRNRGQSTWEQRWEVEKRLLQGEVLRLREEAQREAGSKHRRGMLGYLQQPISKRCARLGEFDEFNDILTGSAERKLQPRGWLLALIDQVNTARFDDMRVRDETHGEHLPFPEFVFQFLVSEMPDLSSVRYAVFDLLVAVAEYRGNDYWINIFGMLLEEEVPLSVHRQLLQILATSQDVLGVGVQYPNTPLRQHPFWVDTDRALRVVEIVRPDLEPSVKESLAENIKRFSQEAPPAEITLLLANDAANAAVYKRIEFDVFVELVVKHLLTDHDAALHRHRDAFIRLAAPGRHLTSEAVRFFFQGIDPTLREREVIHIFTTALAKQSTLPESIGEPGAQSGISWRSVAAILDSRDLVVRNYAHLYTAPVHLLSRDERIGVYGVLEDAQKALGDTVEEQLRHLKSSSMWDKTAMMAKVAMLRDRFDRELSLSINPLRCLHSYRKMLEAIDANQIELQHATGEIPIKYLAKEFQLAQSKLRERQAYGARRGFAFDPTENPIFAVIRRVRAIVWIQRAFKARLQLIREAKAAQVRQRFRDGVETVKELVSERSMPKLQQAVQGARRAKKARRKGNTVVGSPSITSASASGSGSASSPAGAPRRERSSTVSSPRPTTRVKRQSRVSSPSPSAASESSDQSTR